MLFNSYSNRFCDFYILPIVGIGAINFQSKKTGNPPLFSGVFSLQKKWKHFYLDFHKLHKMTNVFVKNLCFYRARFSIQSLFKTTPCLLKRQHENHTGVLASDSSHEYTVDRRSSIRCVSVLDCLYRHRIKLEQRLLLTTSRRIKHLQLRFSLAWFLHLATAEVTESRSSNTYNYASA